MSVIKCEKCGTESKLNDNFCTSCGGEFLNDATRYAKTSTNLAFYKSKLKEAIKMGAKDLIAPAKAKMEELYPVYETEKLKVIEPKFKKFPFSAKDKTGNTIEIVQEVKPSYNSKITKNYKLPVYTVKVKRFGTTLKRRLFFDKMAILLNSFMIGNLDYVDFETIGKK